MVTRPAVFRVGSFAEARARAQETGVWLIVDATAEWCGPCKQMDKVTWRDGDVVRWIEANGIAVQVDVDAESDLAKQLEIRAMPTVIAFKDGEEKDRVVGYRDPKGLLAWMNGLTRGETNLDQVRRSLVDPKNDVRGRLSLARTLLQAGRKDEATEEFIWLWENMARIEPAMIGVRLSYLASDIQSLIESHAPARARVVRIRDELDLTGGAGSTSRTDWLVLNGVLGEQQKTLDWYDVARNDPAAAPEVERDAHQLVELLIERKRWVDIGHMYRDPVAELARRHKMAVLPSGVEIPPEMLGPLQEMMARSFRDRAALLVGCLRSAGRSHDAESVEAEAIRLDASDEMKQALANASALTSETAEQGADDRPAPRDGARRNGAGSRSNPLRSATEAVALYRGLAAKQDSTEVLDGLAVSLHNLGIQQREAGLLRQALDATTEAVELFAKLAERDPDAFKGSLARALTSQGFNQSAIGMSEQAVGSTAQAVAIYRKLASANETSLSELADALGNLGTQNNSLGDKEAALETGLEVVALRRRLAADNPDEAARSELAGSLTNLEAYQGGLGLRKEAMATALEAVALHRTLAASNPTAFLPNLALGLLNLSVSQSRLGLRREAHDSIAEAVSSFRQLNEAAPGAHEANLAMSLVNLGVQQGAIGMLEEALESTQEAVAIRRRLAAGNPGAFLSRLGMSLNNLASKRTTLGLHEDALEAAGEAVSLLRECAAEKPSAFRPNLADSLDTQGEVQIELGHGAAAVASLSEAAVIRRELARALPAAFEPSLAKTLSQLGAAQCAIGKASDSAGTIKEAVAIQRRLALADETSFLPDLATSLDTLGISQLAAGSPDDALAAATEAVALNRRLADARPESFLSDLAKSLSNLGAIHSAAGRHEDAVAAAGEAVQIYAVLASRVPRAFSAKLRKARAVARTALDSLGRPAGEFE